MGILPKVIYRVNETLIKIHMETQKAIHSQSNTKQKTQLEALQYLTLNDTEELN